MIDISMLDIVFPHECEVLRPGGTSGTDKYGQPTKTYAPELIYGGKCRVSQDIELISRETEGSDFAVHTLVYLPEGDHGVSIDDEIHLFDGDWHGRVEAISYFTQEVYTRLLVRRDD